MPATRWPHPTTSCLRKIEGQVRGIQRMTDDGRYCIEILDQITAARHGRDRVATVDR